jgi:hypothetical protein
MVRVCHTEDVCVADGRAQSQALACLEHKMSRFVIFG